MKNNKNLILASVSSLVLLSACAGPESYQQKMARYEPKAISKNQVPDINTANFKFISTEKNSTAKVGRFPASAETLENQNPESKESGPTNKKLYFLALYSEYESLKNYSKEFVGPSVSICPNFHTNLLKYNEEKGQNSKAPNISKKFTYDSAKFGDELYVSSRPELLLPLSKDDITPKVIDLIKSSTGPMSDVAINELVHKALDIHLAKTYSEIRELCEYGVSDNYYIYENLITHIKSNNFKADNKNMNTLLKTTIFSNLALMTSINKYSEKAPKTGRSIASATENKAYASEVIARLNVSWANQYFDYIKESH
jgi:hypothetical protein